MDVKSERVEGVACGKAVGNNLPDERKERQEKGIQTDCIQTLGTYHIVRLLRYPTTHGTMRTNKNTKSRDLIKLFIT